jgi:hypothetical protein
VPPSFKRRHEPLGFFSTQAGFDHKPIAVIVLPMNGPFVTGNIVYSFSRLHAVPEKRV